MKRNSVVGVCLAVAVLAAWEVTVANLRHMRLTASFPAADTTLAASPHHIRLEFSQKPSLPVSRIQLRGAGGPVALGDVHTAHDTLAIAAAVNGTVAAGRYTVNWRTAGDDGHVIRGSFDFELQLGSR